MAREVVLAGGAVVAARVAAAQEGHLRTQGALNVAGRRALGADVDAASLGAEPAGASLHCADAMM